MTKEEIKKIKDMTMLPMVNADIFVEKLERDLLDYRMRKTPYGPLIKITAEKINKIKFEIFVRNLIYNPSEPKCQ